MEKAAVALLVGWTPAAITYFSQFETHLQESAVFISFQAVGE